MTLGKRPVAAIGEAKRNAVAAGFILIELVTEAEFPFDFVVQKDGTTSLVRIRRLKQAGFRIANVLTACAQPIKEMRGHHIPDGLIPELWVRGPARAFHRYRVLPEMVEETGIVAHTGTPKNIPETISGIKSFGIPEDQTQPESQSLVREIPCAAGLTGAPAIPVNKSDPGLPGTLFRPLPEKDP
jgi:hypothetical protein